MGEPGTLDAFITPWRLRWCGTRGLKGGRDPPVPGSVCGRGPKDPNQGGEGGRNVPPQLDRQAWAQSKGLMGSPIAFAHLPVLVQLPLEGPSL